MSDEHPDIDQPEPAERAVGDTYPFPAGGSGTAVPEHGAHGATFTRPSINLGREPMTWDDDDPTAATDPMSRYRVWVEAALAFERLQWELRGWTIEQVAAAALQPNPDITTELVAIQLLRELADDR